MLLSKCGKRHCTLFSTLIDNQINTERFDAFNEAGFNFGDIVHVTISHEGKAYFDQDVLYQKSFGFVKQGEPIVFNGSMLYLGIALNQGHFTNTYSIGDGESWKVRITKA